MRPTWFQDSIPLDPLIAPMVLFFQDHGIKTSQSCQGGGGTHLFGKPTITFRATTLKEIDRVARLLKSYELDTSLEVGLMTGFFSQVWEKRYGRAQWIWTDETGNVPNPYQEFVYDRVIKLVDMKEIKSITMDHDKWVIAGRPMLR